MMPPPPDGDRPDDEGTPAKRARPMSLADARKRLPIVNSLPAPKTRAVNLKDIDRRPIPRYTVWELTLACDHRCLHCGPRAGDARPNELTLDECLKLVDEMAELGVGEVALIGGEAYMRGDHILVVRALREKGISVLLVTGGLGITAERAAAMKEAGVRSVSISIDGMEKSHDYVRGRDGSWKAAFRAWDHLKKAGIPVAVNTQINAFSYTELEDLAQEIGQRGAHAWQIQVTIPHGNGADHPEIVLQPHMMKTVYDYLEPAIDRAEKHGVRILPGNNLGYFGPLESRLRRLQNKMGAFPGCGAGRSAMGIESDGQIKACPTLGGPTNQAGSWREHGLAKLWHEAKEITYFRTRTLDDLWGYCRRCYYAEQCMGGCSATSEPLFGRPGNNPFCYHRVDMLQQEGLRERIEMVVPAEDIPFGTARFKLITEPIDEAERERGERTTVEMPRVDRNEVQHGPAYPMTLD